MPSRETEHISPATSILPECPAINDLQTIKEMYDFVEAEISSCKDKIEVPIQKDPEYNLVPTLTSSSVIRGNSRYLFLRTPTQIVGMRHEVDSKNLLDQININMNNTKPCMSYSSEHQQDSPVNHVVAIKEFVHGFTHS